MQAVGTAVDVFVAALDSHKWVTLGSVSARARKRSSSGALPEAGGLGIRVSSHHLQTGPWSCMQLLEGCQQGCHDRCLGMQGQQQYALAEPGNHMSFVHWLHLSANMLLAEAASLVPRLKRFSTLNSSLQVKLPSTAWYSLWACAALDGMPLWQLCAGRQTLQMTPCTSHASLALG